MAGGALAGTIFYFVSTRLIPAEHALWVDRSLADLTFTFHCWGLSSFYAAALLLALNLRADRILLTPLGAIGRMALTNYLMQATLLVPLCLGLGLFDTFTPTSSLLLALALFAVELPFSMWWLRRFQFGPAEWVWRLLAYGRRPPLRVL